ncbi:MAG: hypothetical protein ACI8X5_002743 [Planctomycetota bacterium]|jgi:hypothetical protein
MKKLCALGLLSELNERDELYAQARTGALRAQCHIDPRRATDELVQAVNLGDLQPGDCRMIVTELIAVVARLERVLSLREPVVGENAPPELAQAQETIACAIEVLKAGKTVFPEYNKWDALVQNVGSQAETLGASEDRMKTLGGLGYLGNG